MKILILDIENSPNLGYMWGLWKQTIALNQLVESSEILCFAAKWLGEDEIFYHSTFTGSKKKMLKAAWKLLNEADAVIHYNGKKHDIPHLNREFLESGLTPPSPYKQIDLYETVKSKFKFPSSKMEYVAERLGLGKKLPHEGFPLWVRCLRREASAWETMKQYNIRDVFMTEEMYNKLLPWISKHINLSLFNQDKLVCPKCGGSHVHKRGFARTLASIYQRYHCTSCGTWFKDNVILNRNNYKTTEIL